MFLLWSQVVEFFFFSFPIGSNCWAYLKDQVISVMFKFRLCDSCNRKTTSNPRFFHLHLLPQHEEERRLKNISFEHTWLFSVGKVPWESWLCSTHLVECKMDRVINQAVSFSLLCKRTAQT